MPTTKTPPRRASEEPRRGATREGYVTVAERLALFHSNHKKGRVITEVITELSDVKAGYVTIRASVYLDAADEKPKATGIAHERADNPQSYVNRQGWFVENCETSAIGRALGIAGILSETSIATQDDMERATAREQAGERPASYRESGPTAKSNAELDATAARNLRGQAREERERAAAAGKQPAQGSIEEGDEGESDEGGATAEPITTAQLKAVKALGNAKGVDVEEWAYVLYGCTLDEANNEQGKDLIARLTKAAKGAKPPKAPAQAKAAAPAEEPKRPEPIGGAKERMVRNSIYEQLRKMTKPHETTGAQFFVDSAEAIAHLNEMGQNEALSDWPADIRGINDLPAKHLKAVLDSLTNDAATFNEIQENRAASAS